MTNDCSATSNIAVESLSRPAALADLQGLAKLLIDAVDSGAAVSFLAPLALPEAEAWWRKTLEDSAPRAIFLVARCENQVVGSVQLQPAWAPNQPHRGEIVKLLVHRRARGQGLGTRLMQSIESLAREAGFRLLTLDAKRGATAERVYQKLGWTQAGIIPSFALDPDGQGWHDTVLYFKEL